MKGTYILVIFLQEKNEIEIGSLGKVLFESGYYFYVGSAMGSSGSTTIINRVKRHLSSNKNKKIHWHIDYLLENQDCIIVKIYLIPTFQRLECVIAQELLKISDGYIKSFGSSDCYCKSHLAYFNNIEDLSRKFI